ncbi:MAG TPA: urea ABC transporter substrate-binding protein [Cyanobacteria bacterium UBA11149]|nr:urea ABC transporter substrate-binding protein [Cyanobacteria bacterium UBA11367]HBE56531.1 urea ABC transporter substrate-binding protein [Cyanobacteria bacterium UBA11366]HBK62375.1 urea ABC transporter substrate-binding protein [Cyanobacteria bacterium UBA11166]HBR75680.1 urea ABC transporter substrate-binding protein [Cyanobacteria bacterium UBA11159]HBS68610.1 urea ABC transporter substrate-binding protein [Cyanobacteria bacterium UBA11153]HBW91331.1 urea ABC transporter substrate-bind
MNETQKLLTKSGATIPVGILHSLSGTMSISEASLMDAELMAIAQINQAGGILGKIIVPTIEDGASNPATFALKARKLLQKDRVATIFGGWTSACRKAVLPVLEEFNAVMWYPVEYEGLECSRHIFYTGMCPNQQVGPAVEWFINQKGKRFYLIGSNYVFPRTANKLIRSLLKSKGGSLVGEEYVELGTTEFGDLIDKIKYFQPDVVFNTLNGDSNLAFYQQYKEAGISSQEIPIVAVSVSEEELRRIGGNNAAGHYASWSYFQSINTPENLTFVQNFQEHYGKDRVTSDSIESAYVQVYLWKQAVEKAGSFDVDLVREAAYGQTFHAPGGKIKIEKNNHTRKYCRIGQILPNGQFKIVFTSPGAIKPQPWLGIEELEDCISPIVFDMLAEVSQSIQYSCQVEQKSREIEAANARLQKTQDQLLEAQSRFKELEAREKLLQRRLSSQIRNSLELDRILSTAVKEIRSLLQIDRCQFFWYHPNGDESTFELMEEASEPLGEGEKQSSLDCLEGLTELLEKQCMLRIDRLYTEVQIDISSCHGDRIPLNHQNSVLRESANSLMASGLKALLIAPVHTRAQKIGVVVCEHFRDRRSWSDREVELIASVVDQLSSGIDQAELYAQSCTTAAIATAQAKQLKQALHDLQSYQAQLVQTEKMSTLGTLVAGIAHEINNPTSFIYGNLHYAKEYTQNLLELVKLYQKYYPEPISEIQDYAQTIEMEFLIKDLPKTISSMEIGAERIRHLVGSLRNFSRTDRGEMYSVNLHEGIESTLLILRNRFKGNGQHPSIELIEDYGDLPRVDCYPSQINQVFLNLINNAIDALAEFGVGNRYHIVKGKTIESPTIWIITERLNNDRVTIRIADNGPGMTEEVKSKLFDPFFTTKPIGKGTGLGLSISYQIVVEKHGGILHCTSAPGEGTEFAIELPVLQYSEAQTNGKMAIHQTQHKTTPVPVTAIDN